MLAGVTAVQVGASSIGVTSSFGSSAVTRADTLVRKLGLTVCVPPGLQSDELLELMARDKKSAGTLTFVLPGPNGIERVDDPDRAAIDKAFAAIGVTT